MSTFSREVVAGFYHVSSPWKSLDTNKWMPKKWDLLSDNVAIADRKIPPIDC
jgi:hypothetical protein